MYPIIKILNFEISVNWLLIVISMFLMAFFNSIRSKKYKISIFQAILTAVLVNIFAILGAFCLYKLENIGGKNGFGLSFFGTVFFLPIFMLIPAFIMKKNILKYSDFWAVFVPMELAIVRIGCFLGGCCLGVYSPIGVHFPFDPDNFNRVPIQLIECVLDIIIFVFLIHISKKKHNTGIIYPLFMMTYGFIRFILEYFRDTPKFLLGLSNGQWFAFVSFITGTMVFILIKKHKKNDI